MAITGSGGNATVDANGNAVTFSGNLSGPGGLVETGSGELTLSGTDTYTGGTTISGGTLDIASPSALSGSGLVTIGSGGRLVLGSGAGIGALLAASPPIASNPVALIAAAMPQAMIGETGGEVENAATTSDEGNDCGTASPHPNPLPRPTFGRCPEGTIQGGGEAAEPCPSRGP